MSNDLKYKFKHSAFNLSTDYDLLWELIQKRNLRIPAWVVYSDKYGEDEIIWDIVEVKNSYVNSEPNNYSIGTRGVGYEGRMNFEGFKMCCTKFCLHFINPINHNI